MNSRLSFSYLPEGIDRKKLICEFVYITDAECSDVEEEVKTANHNGCHSDGKSVVKTNDASEKVPRTLAKRQVSSNDKCPGKGWCRVQTNSVGNTSMLSQRMDSLGDRNTIGEASLSRHISSNGFSQNARATQTRDVTNGPLKGYQLPDISTCTKQEPLAGTKEEHHGSKSTLSNGNMRCRSTKKRLSTGKLPHLVETKRRLSNEERPSWQKYSPLPPISRCESISNSLNQNWYF